MQTLADPVDPWQVLGDPTRRRVLALVAEQARSVTDIAARLPVSRPAVSQHLRILLDAHLVTARPQGRRRLYCARAEGLESVRADLDHFWAQALVNFKQVAEDPTTEDPS